MAWKIEFETAAVRELKKLDRTAAKRIVHFLQDRVANSEDPRLLAKPLQGQKFESLWRFRIGDFRVVSQIVGSTIIVTVVRIGHRKDIYKR